MCEVEERSRDPESSGENIKNSKDFLLPLGWHYLLSQ